MIKLSILVLTTPRRRSNVFQDILANLEYQVGDMPVEIIGLYDNKRRTVGEKRNAALSIARGEYLAFIDDDDYVASDYVASILRAINDNPGVDIIVFDCITSIHKNGQVIDKHYSKYSKDFLYSISDRMEDGFKQWRGKPAHTMVWRAAIAKAHAFPDKSYGEDVDWVIKANVDLRTEARIDKVLYYYRFNPEISETRG